MKITAELKAISILTLEEQEQITKWLWEARHINCFDPDVLTYPRVIVAKASDENGGLLYIPLQAALIWESVAPMPGISNRQEAVCLARIEEQVVRAQQDAGFGESIFLCKDDSMSNFVAHQDHWEELVGYRVLRRKLTKEERKAWEPPVVEIPKE
jgi:hypothetical protein